MNDSDPKNAPPPLRPSAPNERPKTPSFEELQRAKDKNVGLSQHQAVTQPGYPGPFAASKTAARQTGELPKPPTITRLPTPPPLPRPPPIPRAEASKPRLPPPPLRPSLSTGSLPTVRSLRGPFEGLNPEVTPSAEDTIPPDGVNIDVTEPPSHTEETLDDVPVEAARVDELQVIAVPATLWRRVLAFTIDAGLVGSLAVGFLLAAASVTKAKVPPPSLGLFDLWLFRLSAWHGLVVATLVLTVVLTLVYTTLGAFLWNGRTLGRLLTGVRLVNKQGDALTPVHALTRATFALISSALFFAGFWLALFDRRGQTLHDKLASTFVVRLQT